MGTLTQLFVLCSFWVDVHGSDWGVMGSQSPFNVVILPKVALVDVEILRTDVKGFLLTAIEIKTVSINWHLVYIT